MLREDSQQESPSGVVEGGSRHPYVPWCLLNNNTGVGRSGILELAWERL